MGVAVFQKTSPKTVKRMQSPKFEDNHEDGVLKDCIHIFISYILRQIVLVSLAHEYIGDF